MCDSELRNTLTLTPVQDSSCACCAPAAPSPSTDALEAAPEQFRQETQTLDVGVDGLSCGSCVRKVETALSAVQDAVASTGYHLSER